MDGETKEEETKRINRALAWACRLDDANRRYHETMQWEPGGPGYHERKARASREYTEMVIRAAEEQSRM